MAIWVWYRCKGKGIDIYVAYALCQVVLSPFTHFYLTNTHKSGAVTLLYKKKKKTKTTHKETKSLKVKCLA